MQKAMYRLTDKYEKNGTHVVFIFLKMYQLKCLIKHARYLRCVSFYYILEINEQYASFYYH